jgi:AraC-like DNA-binding protein
VPLSMNAALNSSNNVPSVALPASDEVQAVAPCVPMEIIHALDQCLIARRYGASPIAPICGGAGFSIKLERPDAQGAGEFVRLGEGVWLCSGAWRVDSRMAVWSRHRGSLCFTVVLGGGVHFADERTLEERFVLVGGCGAVGAHISEVLTYVQYFAGVTTEAVSVFFRDSQAMRNFGLDPHQVFSYLAADSVRVSARTATAVCAPEREALLAAHAIRGAPYEGGLRHLYLRGKACEMLSHLLASRVVARTAAESQIMAGVSDTGMAAVAHAALADTECHPTARAIARRLGVTERQLLRAFKTTYGASLHEHAASMRMARGRRLLLQTQLPLIQVALECGYEHHSSFSTAYLRTYGETPVQTRRRALRPS